ncbi:hypothetical protein AB4Z42_02610 [Mycobacterium sp. 2YAF39]|uniref:TPR repeat region-containing protein n=1 Tax=Mycobacterium sp. 2YAF39 TaxID=3233033 RepID=UPI003F987381
MGITLADVQGWQPEQIDEVSQAAAQRARTSGQTAETLRNLSVFGTWKGEAGEAAQQAINQSATTLALSQKEAFLVALGAGQAAADVRKVKNDLQSLVDYANAAPAVQLDLASNSVIPPDTTGMTDEDVETLRKKTEEIENKMAAVLAAADEADADLARVLTAATGGDPELPGEQGTNDGTSLQDGQLTPEEMARLEENTNLTPEQQEALVRGDLVLPASQMEYLNNLSRSLDGKSPAEIRSMIDQMNANGQNGGAVSDALQLLGNENITTAGEATDGVPTQGGMQNLPSGIRETFERPTRGPAVPTPGTNEQGNPTIEMPNMEKPFPEIDNYRDVAAIVSAGDANLQQGTAMDEALLNKSEEILHGMHSPPHIPWEDNPDMSQRYIDPAVQDMLSAAGRDQMAVHDELAGANGATPNNEFIGDLLKHQWADDGAAAGTLLNGTGAVPTDLTDPTQMAQATRAGEIMHAVDQYVGNGANADQLLDIPGTENQSLGQVNPELTQALAEANKPFIDDMLGNKLDSSQGFKPLDDLLNPEMPVMRDLFAVIDTNPEAAGILNGQAYADGLQYQANFEQSVIDGGPANAGDLHSAGTLKGVIDTAARIADNDAIEYGNLQDVKAYESRGQWFEMAKTIGGEIPGVDALLDWNGKMPGDPLQQMFVGDAPVGADPEHVRTQTAELMQYTAAQRLLESNIGNPDVFKQLGLIDPNTNQFLPLTANLDNFRTAFNSYFLGIDPTVKAAIDSYADGYRYALPTGEPHTGG